MDIWDLIECVDDLRTAAREEARLRREAQTEIDRLRAQVHWLLAQAQRGDGITATYNPDTGYFIQRNIVQNGELYDRKRLAYAGRGESFGRAIDNALAGRDPDADILAKIKRERAAEREGEG